MTNENPYKTPLAPTPPEAMLVEGDSETAIENQQPDWIDGLISIGIGAVTALTILPLTLVAISAAVPDPAQHPPIVYVCITMSIATALAMGRSYLNSKRS